jgi:hypothetical protein
MKQRPQIYYSESQKALMWERWKRGDSLQMIAQMFDRNHFGDRTDTGCDRWHTPSAAMPLQAGINVG